MGDSDDEGRGGAASDVPAGPIMGPIYQMWESTLEKLKLLDYETNFCSVAKGRMPFNRVHFVFPGANPSVQLDDFFDICAWLCFEISRSGDTFKRDQFDDPNTVVNKLMLALRQLDFRSTFPPTKLRTAHGEPVCTVLEFLADKALSSKKFTWVAPKYPVAEEEQQQADLDEEEAGDEINDEAEGAVDDELFFQESIGAEPEVSLDNSAHHMLTSHIDPVAWKTELERVGPRLRAQQQLASNEWRAHVDQTVSSKSQIEQLLSIAQGDLKSLNRDVAEGLGKMQTREKYINNQFVSAGQDFKEIRQKLELLENKCSSAQEVTSKLNNELSELGERADELKDMLESKDSGIHDTSPLVRIKAALQQLKNEVYSFDLRVGVISNTLLAHKVSSSSRKKFGSRIARKKNWKNHGKHDEHSHDLSGEDDE